MNEGLKCGEEIPKLCQHVIERWRERVREREREREKKDERRKRKADCISEFTIVSFTSVLKLQGSD